MATAPAEAAPDKLTRRFAKFDIVTGTQSRARCVRATLTYTNVFANGADRGKRNRDSKIVAINGAMPSGTGSRQV